MLTKVRSCSFPFVGADVSQGGAVTGDSGAGVSLGSDGRSNLGSNSDIAVLVLELKEISVVKVGVDSAVFLLLSLDLAIRVVVNDTDLKLRVTLGDFDFGFGLALEDNGNLVGTISAVTALARVHEDGLGAGSR